MKKFSYLLATVLLSMWSFLALPVTTVAAADTCTWTGTSSADWSDSGNWDNCDGAGIPENGDSLVFPSGSGPTSNNDIAGTLTIDQIDVTGDNYAITGNAIEISGYLQFTGNDNNFNMADMTFANASTGTSLVINGTGNTITNAIGLNMSGGHDFNIYTNQDFTAPLFSGGSIGNFNKQGSANLTTSTSASTFTATGAVNVTDGLFICNNANCGGVSANNFQVSGGSVVLDGSNITDFNHDINLASSSSPQLNMLPGTVDINGDITVNATGTIYAQTGTLTINGNVLLSGNDLYLLTSSTTTATIVQDSASVISDSGGNRSLNVIGGRVQLNGDNNYPGVTNVTNNSVLQISNNNSLGGTAGGTVVESGSVLAATTSLTSPEPLQLEGTGVPVIFSGSYVGALVNDGWDPTFTGDILLNGNTTIMSVDGGITLSGSISGVADLTIKGRVGGTSSINGSTSNTYSGNTYIDSARLYLGKTSGNAVNGNIEITSTDFDGYLIAGNNGGNQIADDATINLVDTVANNSIFEGTDSTEIIGTITGNGHLESDGPGYGFTIGGGDMSGTFTGTIDNEEGTITKVGTGTWTLDGVTQPNAGTTFSFVVNSGKIVWNSTVSGAPMTVNSGGTLKGNGTLGTTSVNTGGTIAAGNSPGCITVSNLTLGAGSTFEEEIAGGTACTEYDRTNVNGNANLGGANLSVLPSYTPAPGTVYTILQTTNGNVIGTFNGLADGATFTANGIQFRINYTSTQVNLTVLGGSLVPTGQNHNGVAYLAALVMMLGAGGLYYSLRRKKLSIKRIAL